MASQAAVDVHEIPQAVTDAIKTLLRELATSIRAGAQTPGVSVAIQKVGDAISEAMRAARRQALRDALQVAEHGNPRLQELLPRLEQQCNYPSTLCCGCKGVVVALLRKLAESPL